MGEVDLEKSIKRSHHREFNEQECYVCGQIWPCDAIQLADEVERLNEHLRNYAANEDALVRETQQQQEALGKLGEDKNCTGNCALGDGKVTALCWRHTVIRAALSEDPTEVCNVK